MEDIAVIAKDPRVMDIKRNIDATNAALASLEVRYKEQYPTVKSTMQALTNLQNDLAAATDQIYKNLKSAAELAASQVAADEAAVGIARANKLAMDRTRMAMVTLVRDAATSQALWDSVIARTRDTELLEKIKSNNIALKEPAVKPDKPVKPNIPLVLFLGVFGGLMCSIAFALLANYLDNAVKGQEDVEGYLGLTFLGYVPHIEATDPVDRDLKRISTPPRSRFSEGFRTIRASVSLTNLHEKLRSASPWRAPRPPKASRWSPPTSPLSAPRPACAPCWSRPICAGPASTKPSNCTARSASRRTSRPMCRAWTRLSTKPTSRTSR